MSSSEFDSSQGSARLSSSGTSRLDSFNSSNGGPVQSSDFNMQTSFDDVDRLPLVDMSPISSSSSRSKRRRGFLQGNDEASATNSNTDRSSAGRAEMEDLEIVEADGTMSPMIQKWVDESCVETERLKTTRDEEEKSPLSSLALQQALGLSLHRSPSLGGLDASLSSLGDFQSHLNPTESMLMGLGFGGPDLGIPERFLKSWREKIIKQRINELQGFLGRSRKSPSPTGSAKQYSSKPKEAHQPYLRVQEEVIESKDVKEASCNDTGYKQQTVTSKPAVKPSDKQLQLEKLKTMRQQLRKSATVSSLLHDPKQHNSKKDQRKKGAICEKKYQKFRGATKVTAKDRRRAFVARQSSLPISLETLPEEDEGRPSFLPQKSNSFDYIHEVSSHASRATSLNSSAYELTSEYSETEEERPDTPEELRRDGPQIITTEPPITSSDTVRLEEGDNHDILENLQKSFDGQHLLVIKKIIESKDSGIGNDISNGASPQASPEHQSDSDNQGDDLKEGKCATDISMNNSGRQRSQKDRTNDKSQTVDLCIQVDFPDHISDSESETECTSAGVQTSPCLLHSGELSPLSCGDYASSAEYLLCNDVKMMGQSEDRVEIQRDIDKDLKPSAAGYGVLMDGQSEGGRSGQDEQYDDKYTLPQKDNPNILEFPDCFNADKRRLSRIEEDTDTIPSQQSEDERIKLSLESQKDSSQPTSTCSNSSLVFPEFMKTSDEINPETSVKRPQANFKKLPKKIYEEMLRKNAERDLHCGDQTIQLRARDVLPEQLTVDEMLKGAARKLELISQNSLEFRKQKTVDENIAQPENSTQSHMKSYHESPKDLAGGMKSADDNHKTSVNEAKLRGKKEYDEQLNYHKQSPANSESPKDHPGSMKSRLFFASKCFASFTDHVKDLEEGWTPKSDVSNVGSFFNIPVELDPSEEEEHFNFSLCGSDMNCVIPGEDTNNISRMASKELLGSFEDSSLSEQSYFSKDSLLTDLNISEEQTKTSNSEDSSLMSYDEASSPLKIHHGAFSETIKSPSHSQKKKFTQTLDINVPCVHPVESVIFSHKFVYLQKQKITCVVGKEEAPFKYSSKYYYTVEDYSKGSDEELEEEPKNERLSKWRHSVIESHLSAKIFNNTLDEQWYGNSNIFSTRGRSELDRHSNGCERKWWHLISQEEADVDLVNEVKNGKCGNYGRNRETDFMLNGRTVSSNDSTDGSTDSSVTSSKVDYYVDDMLENALKDVRGILAQDTTEGVNDVGIMRRSGLEHEEINQTKYCSRLLNQSHLLEVNQLENALVTRKEGNPSKMLQVHDVMCCASVESQRNNIPLAHSDSPKPNAQVLLKGCDRACSCNNKKKVIIQDTRILGSSNNRDEIDSNNSRSEVGTRDELIWRVESDRRDLKQNGCHLHHNEEPNSLESLPSYEELYSKAEDFISNINAVLAGSK